MIFIMVIDRRTKVYKTINMAHIVGYWEDGEYTRISLTTESILVQESVDEVDDLIQDAIKKGMSK